MNASISTIWSSKTQYVVNRVIGVATHRRIYLLTVLRFENIRCFTCLVIRYKTAKINFINSGAVDII